MRCRNGSSSLVSYGRLFYGSALYFFSIFQECRFGDWPFCKKDTAFLALRKRPELLKVLEEIKSRPLLP